MKKTLLLLLSVAVLAPLTASAHPYHLTSVRWIVATRNKITYDDRYVTMIGHITRRMGDEEYWFTDGTGSVRLDSENFDLPVGPRLVIGGRIDQAYLGFGHIEVDVRSWKYAPRRVVTESKPITHAANLQTTAPAIRLAPEPAPVVNTPPPEPTHSSTPTPVSTSVPVPAANTAPTLAPPAETVTTPASTSAPEQAPMSAPSPAPAATPAEPSSGPAATETNSTPATH